MALVAISSSLPESDSESDDVGFFMAWSQLMSGHSEHLGYGAVAHSYHLGCIRLSSTNSS